MPRHARFVLLTAAAASLLCAGAAASIVEPAITIVADNDSGHAVWTRPLSAFDYDSSTGEYSYHVNVAEDLLDGATVVARLRELHLFMVDQPTLSARTIMQASVMAGLTETTFSINPGLISYPTIPAPYAEAVMSWVVIATDNVNSGDDYVKMQGIPQGTPVDEDIYRSWYNQTERFGNSASLLEAWDGPGCGMTLSGTYPEFGMEPLGVTVDDMNVETAFTLTPMDVGQVQTVFVVTPEPAALGFLVAGAAVLLLRRR